MVTAKEMLGACGTSLLTSHRTFSRSVANCRQGSSVAGKSGEKLTNTPPKEMNSALPAGTSHVRSAIPPKLLARNHTFPCWFLSQYRPSGSNAGFVEMGSTTNQLVHSLASSL